MKNRLLFTLLASIGLIQGAFAQTAPTFSGISLTPAAGLVFPLTYLTQESQPLTATIKNTYLGSAATISAVNSSDPQYVVTAETCTAAPLAKAGGTCTVTVKYVPTAVATASSAKINITRTTAGGNFWIPLTGSADTVPKVPTLPAATIFSGINQTPAQGLAFAELLPGLTSPSQRLTIKNTYLGSAITISAVASSDPQFVVTAETCTTAPLAKNGGTCTVDVAFKPAAAGTFAGKINFTRTSAGGNFYANLSGIGKGTATPTTGYTGASLTPTSLAFPDTAKGSTSAEQTITVKNTYAGTTWKVNSVSANISSYKVTSNDCSTLAPGATCTIKVAFAPTLVQALNGTITINRTVGTTTSNMIVKATGKGLAGTATPTVTLSATPAPLTFDTTPVGTSQNKTLTVANASTTAVTVSAAAVTPADFSIVANSCGTTALAGGASCTLTLKFAPTTEGTKTGTVTLTPSTGNPLTVALNGSSVAATAAQLRAEPGVVVLPATQIGGTSSPVTVTLTNAGGTTLAISGVTASPSTEFPMTSACGASLAPNGACTVAISFKPAATGGRTGTLSIVHNGVGSPSAIQLGGNGVAASEIYAEPVSVDFGSMATGSTSSAHTVTFYNAATTAAAIQPLELTGDATEFTQTNTCGTSLASGATCTATTTFKPTSSGAKHAILAMKSAADSSLIQAIDLTGAASVAQGALTATPATLTFPSTNVGATSAAQTVVVTNTGTANVTVGQMAATTSDFSWTSNCGTLAPAASCTLSIEFNPSSSGAKSATLNIANNGAGGTLAIPLSGAAATTPGTIVLSPTSIAFADTAVGSSSVVKTVSLTNTGGSPVASPVVSVTSADYAVSSNCGASLAVGTSCTASLTFSPTATGARTGNLSVTWTGATAPVTAGLTGNGVGVPAVTLSASSLTFAPTDVGQQSAGQSVTVTNSGSGNLAVSSVVLSSAELSQSNTCGTTVVPNGTCQVTVKLTPQTAGAKTGTLTLNHNAGSGSSTVSLAGTANAPMAKLSTSLANYAFPDTNLGASSTGTITLNNTGTAATALGTITSSNTAEFPVTATTCGTSLAAGASCTMTVKFVPAQAGSRSGTLTIPYGTSTASLSVALTGNGVNNAQITVSPTSLTFPPTTVGATSAAQTVTMTNSGTTPLVVSSITAPSTEFSMTQSCVATWAPGATCAISLRYAPTAVGNASGNLTIASNAVNAATKTVPVTGTAVSPGVVSLNLNPVSLPTTQVGQTGTATVTLTNTGGSNLTVSAIAGATSELTVTNGCSGTVVPGGSCVLTLAFKPTTVGAKTGTLTLTHTGQGGTTALNWTGVATGIPAMSLSENPISFGTTSKGSPLTKTLTVTNTGTGDLTVSTAALTTGTDFSVASNTCAGAAIAPAASCVLTLKLNATTVGAKTDTLTLANNSSTPSVTTSLSGTVTGVGYVQQLSTTGFNKWGPAYIDSTDRVWFTPAYDADYNSGVPNISWRYLDAKVYDFNPSVNPFTIHTAKAITYTDRTTTWNSICPNAMASTPEVFARGTKDVITYNIQCYSGTGQNMYQSQVSFYNIKTGQYLEFKTNVVSRVSSQLKPLSWVSPSGTQMYATMTSSEYQGSINGTAYWFQFYNSYSCALGGTCTSKGGTNNSPTASPVMPSYLWDGVALKDSGELVGITADSSGFNQVATGVYPNVATKAYLNQSAGGVKGLKPQNKMAILNPEQTHLYFVMTKTVYDVDLSTNQVTALATLDKQPFKLFIGGSDNQLYAVTGAGTTTVAPYFIYRIYIK